MLDADEQRALHDSVDRVRRRASIALRAVDGSTDAVAFVSNLHRGIDRVASDAAAAGSAPECRPGCAFCCQLRVEVTEPEALLMARWVRRRPPHELDALIERLRGGASMRSDDPTRRSDCAFLVDRRCAAYEVRPATCRTAHSLSRAACEALATAIPQNLKLVADAEALMAGTAQAYRDARLAATPQELHAAVLDAVVDASSEAHWYAPREAEAGTPR